MTKAHFRKLSQLEGTMMIAAAFICFSNEKYLLGILAFILSLICSFGHDKIIKKYNEEGYKIQ